FGSIHVAFSCISNIMNEKRHPQAGVDGKTVQARPGDKNKKRMQAKTVRAAQDALGPDRHALPPTLYPGHLESPYERKDRQPGARIEILPTRTRARIIASNSSCG